MVLLLYEHIWHRTIVLALSCTNCSHHQVFWCLLEVLGWLNAHVLSNWPLCGSTERTTHFCTCNIQFLCAVCWEPDTSRQGRFTEHVQAVCTAHAERIWHFLEALGWYQIDMYVSAPGTQKYSALKGFCSAWRDFHCFPTQPNSTARLNPLERVKHPGIAGWYLW